MTVEVVNPGLIGNAWRYRGDVIEIPDAHTAWRHVESGRVRETARMPATILAERAGRPHSQSKRITFGCAMFPGDIIALAGALRDFKWAYPHIRLSANTRSAEVWQNNPDTDTQLWSEGSDYCDATYDLGSNPGCHIVECFRREIARIVGVPRFDGPNAGAIYLSQAEREIRPLESPYWVVMAGGKDDIHTKWYPWYQNVVNLLAGKVRFVQCGELEYADGIPHRHEPLDGVVNLVGKTNLRAFFQTVYHADGVLCPITMAMHVAGALGKRAVVLAGGREPASLTHYAGHVRFDAAGSMDCCRVPCWKSVSEDCQHFTAGHAECMRRIAPEAVAKAICESDSQSRE